MKKKMFILCAVLFLSACSSQKNVTPVSGELEKINQTEEIIYE